MHIFRHWLSVLALIALSATTAVAGPMTSEAIVQMNQSGIGDEAIIAKIKSDGTAYDLSAEQMIALRKAGLSSAVIAAMLSNRPGQAAPSLDSADPSVPHPPGVYLLSGTGGAARMVRMDPTVSTQAKTGGILGYAITGGIASLSVKVSIQNQAARIRAGAQPKFYFFFEQPSAMSASSTWASGMNTVVTSPSEFTLVRLFPKSGRREAKVGSTNIAGSKVGVMDKDRIAFDYRMVSPGVYEVVIAPSLVAGEYGFIFAIGGGNVGGATTARIFDFGVDG